MISYKSLYRLGAQRPQLEAGGLENLMDEMLIRLRHHHKTQLAEGLEDTLGIIHGIIQIWLYLVIVVITYYQSLTSVIFFLSHKQLIICTYSFNYILNQLRQWLQVDILLFHIIPKEEIPRILNPHWE